MASTDVEIKWLDLKKPNTKILKRLEIKNKELKLPTKEDFYSQLSGKDKLQSNKVSVGHMLAKYILRMPQSSI